MKRGKTYEWIPFYVDKWIFGSTRIELGPAERGVWVDLMMLAAKDDGYVRANETTAYPLQQLSGMLCVDLELLTKTIEKCIGFDKLVRDEKGILYLTNWSCYTLSDRHKRRFMSANPDALSAKAAKNGHYTDTNTNTNTDTDTNTSPEQNQKHIRFDDGTRTWTGIEIEDLKAWTETYPVCNIQGELRKMAEWLKANPNKKKSNYRRFITGWLGRNQDRGGSDNEAGKGRRDPDPPQSGMYFPPTAAEKEMDAKLRAEFEMAKKKFMAAKGYQSEDDIPFSEEETFAMFKQRKIREGEMNKT